VIAATATELILEAKYVSTTLNIVWKKKPMLTGTAIFTARYGIESSVRFNFLSFIGLIN